jgi:hypothetical protein
LPPVSKQQVIKQQRGQLWQPRKGLGTFPLQQDVFALIPRGRESRRVGNALIYHSTIAECDHAHFARHSQVASQGTGAVNVRNADMTMY